MKCNGIKTHAQLERNISDKKISNETSIMYRSAFVGLKKNVSYKYIQRTLIPLTKQGVKHDIRNVRRGFQARRGLNSLNLMY